MNLLEVRDLSVSFGGVNAVQDVSFDVERGTIYSIIGPNGAGKSTLFNLITRIIRADKGSIRLDGADLLAVHPSEVSRCGLARSFQNLELFAEASIADNILVGRHIHFKTSLLQELLGHSAAAREEAENRSKVDEIIALLGLGSYCDKPIKALPYGICKIVELGRALACDPKILLLDEPAAGLNTTETDRMGDWIEVINKELEVTILLIEHDMRLVSRVSRRVLALNAGCVLAEGSAFQVQNHPDVVRAYLGE